jgi:hypothetical protein
MHNSKALRFNVSKKLAQLEKVIQLFHSQICDRHFQLEHLHRKFDPEINSNLAGYRTQMEPLQNAADTERDQLIQKTDNLFRRKVEQLIGDSKNFARGQESSLAQVQEKNEAEIAELMKQIRTIMNSLENKTMAVNAYVDAAKKKIAADVKTVIEKYRQEVKSHNDISARKKATLVDDTKKHLSEMEATHKREMDELKSSPKSGNSAQPKVLERLRTIKQQINHMRSTLAANRDNVKSLLETRNQNGRMNKQKIAAFVAELTNLRQEYQTSIQKLNSDCTQTSQANNRELEQLTQELAVQGTKHASEYQQAKQAGADRIDGFAREFSTAEARCKSSYDSFGDSIQQLAQRHQQDLERLQRQHNEAIKQSNLRLAQCHREA